MKNFGATIRDLRIAQEFGLRETATMAGISPAYLSRIERGKESPPRPELIKALARVLAVDPDVLFRLSPTTDPEITDYLHERPEVMKLLRFMKDAGFTSADIEHIMRAAEKRKGKSKNLYGTANHPET